MAKSSKTQEEQLKALVKQMQADITREQQLLLKQTQAKENTVKTAAPNAPLYTTVAGNAKADYIFLDDARTPADATVYGFPENKAWRILKSSTEFEQYLKKHGVPKFISFDYNLNADKNGHDCAKQLVQYCLENDVDLPQYTVHDALESSQRFINGYLGMMGKHRRLYKAKQSAGK